MGKMYDKTCSESKSSRWVELFGVTMLDDIYQLWALNPEMDYGEMLLVVPKQDLRTDIIRRLHSHGKHGTSTRVLVEFTDIAEIAEPVKRIVGVKGQYRILRARMQRRTPRASLEVWACGNKPSKTWMNSVNSAGVR